MRGKDIYFVISALKFLYFSSIRFELSLFSAQFFFYLAFCDHRCSFIDFFSLSIPVLYLFLEFIFVRFVYFVYFIRQIFAFHFPCSASTIFLQKKQQWQQRQRQLYFKLYLPICRKIMIQSKFFKQDIKQSLNQLQRRLLLLLPLLSYKIQRIFLIYFLIPFNLQFFRIFQPDFLQNSHQYYSFKSTLRLI